MNDLVGLLYGGKYLSNTIIRARILAKVSDIERRLKATQPPHTAFFMAKMFTKYCLHKHQADTEQH